MTGQVKSEIFLDPKYFWTQIVFSLLVSLNLWLTISCIQNSLKLNFFLWPKNFSKIDQVDYLTVEYFESSWNLENLELEGGPAQSDLFPFFSPVSYTFLIEGVLKYCKTLGDFYLVKPNQLTKANL